MINKTLKPILSLNQVHVIPHKVETYLNGVNVHRKNIGQHIHGKLTLAETLTHVGYCSAAFMDGHGIYAIFALILAVTIIATHFFPGPE